jgi:uncharacterized protein with von Willebrand factor type A (vWA) domain
VSAVAAVAGFGGALRAAGLPVGTGRLLAFREAAELVPEGDLYWAGRATLVARRDEIPVYDRVFRAYFGGAAPQRHAAVVPRVRVHVAGAARPAGVEGTEVEGTPEAALASRAETLRRKSFAACSPEELAELAGLMRRVRLALPERRTRRRAPSRTGAPDLRRTLRRALRTGGEPALPAWRDRSRRRRRLVLLLDISGSMSAYSRALVVFAHAALRADQRFEAFSFGTRLTRLSRPLATGRPDEALRRAAHAAADWDGGTRIGEALKEFLDHFGHSGLARGAVVAICSDGLETGDPELLAAQMARLHRLAFRVVWLNPLRENPAYEPLARGMRAALPHVDLFAGGHSLASLEAIADAVAELRR